MIRGAQPLSLSLFISAPIRDKGVIMRFIGRFSIDSSPVSLQSKGWADRIPEISLVVVPEFPV